MFSELILVSATFIGVGYVGDFSIILGIILFSVLTYFCTQNCLYESVGKKSETKTNTFLYYLNQYTYVIGNNVHRIICYVRWSYLLLQARKLFFVLRILRGNRPKANKHNASQNETEVNSNQTCNNQKSVDIEISTIVDCILREYIKWWYHNKISEDTQFINEVNSVIRDTLSSFCNSVSNVEKKKLCCRLLQLYLHFIFHFKEALKKVGSEQNFLEICLSKKEVIAKNFKMHHWAMKDKMTEWFYLQSVMSSLVDSFGPSDFFSCPILHSVIVEILTRTVLYSLINTLSDPERINSWIYKLLQTVLKNENEPFLQLSNSKTVDINQVKEISNTFENLETPIIIFKDDSSLIRDNVTRSQSLGVANDSRTSWKSSTSNEISPSEISDSSEIFEPNIGDTLQNNIHMQSNKNNTNTKPQLLFPCVNSKAISNENLFNQSFNLYINKSNYSLDALDVARMKRSKSADYIRQMPHMLGLLPLNQSNQSIRLRGQDNKTYIEFKTEVPDNCDLEMAEEAKELPPLFSDLKITHTFQHEDINRASYTLYCIQYSGIFQDTTNPVIPTLVKQVVNIRRRFREFLALQSRLEDNPSLKRLLRGIKGPSKWLTTPFSHLDKKNISERRIFLENYLQELCKYAEICRSSEFQEFLAYGGDATIAFVKKPDYALRFDKMIVRSVKGAIDLFRIPAPISSAELIAKETGSSEGEVEPMSDDSMSETDFQVFVVDFSISNPFILDEINCYISRFVEYDSSSSTDCLLPSNRKSNFLYHSFSINDYDNCDCTEIISSSDLLKRENILSDVLIDIIVESFHKLPETKTTSNIQLFKFLCGSVFDRYMEEKFDDISEEMCARLLHSFHRAVWPEDKNKPKGNKIIDLPILLSKFMSVKLNGILKSTWYGKLFPHIFGFSEVSSAIEIIMGSVQNDSLNKCFLFYTLDALCEFLCNKNL